MQPRLGVQKSRWSWYILLTSIRILGGKKLTPTTTPQDTLLLLPLGPWNGCLLANIASGLETQLASTLFKQWRPAVAIISIHASFSRSDTIAMLPTGLPPFYHKKTTTLCHASIGGITSAVWRFVHYSRWEGIISYPSLMTRDTLPCTLQTSLSDTNGGARGASFK